MTEKSDTERVNELKSKLEAHEARTVLAEYSDEDTGPETFEDLDDEVAKKLARTVARGNVTRQNAHTDELQGAINGNVASSSRSEWERRKNGDS